MLCFWLLYWCYCSLMYRFYTFRAEMVFIMTLLTPAMLLIGAYHLTGEYREAGIFLLISWNLFVGSSYVYVSNYSKGCRKGIQICLL